jgi:carboxynorspermidine decarboxylase
MSMSSVIAAVDTPAFVIDERVVVAALEEARRVCRASGCKLLYTLKPLASPFLLELMRPYVDGFAASSPFEARLARSVIEDGGSIHLTTPGFRPADMAEIDELCDYVAFNSLGQYRRLAGTLERCTNVGLRINPQLSIVDDPRYNPCRAHSKLGVPINKLRRALKREPELADGLRGVQFHTNCDGEDYAPLLRTVEHIEARLPRLLPKLEWMNLGGGYLLDPPNGYQPLIDACERLRSRYGLETFIEPGAAIVRDAGVLVAEVIDLFRSGGRTVAVLDTTVNHNPEVFEYQFEPDVLGDDENGEHEYLLAGSTCLAGDIFGFYGFAEPLHLGSRIVMTGVGAYTMVKAHMFNGVNLPTIYSVTRDGGLVVRRRFTYHDFVSRCGTPSDAIV